MKMFKVLVVFVLIAAISFFVSKYFWIRTPTDTKTECNGGICPPPEGYQKEVIKNE